MSFGYGVGDVMAISRLALKVYSAYKDAPDDYRNISDEVKSLHIIIGNATQHFKSTTLSDNKRQEGHEVLNGCRNVLEDLDSLIIKYNSLASGSASTSQVIQRFKLGTEDIATLRARLTSNTVLLNGFIQSCDSDKMQAQLNSALGLRRTMSKDSIVSFAGSINTKKAYKKFCKGLFEIGVTADIIKANEKKIQDMLKPATSGQADDSTIVDPNQLLVALGTSSDAETSPISAITMSTDTSKTKSRFGWVRPPIDFLVGPLMLSAAAAGNTKRFISTLGFVRDINFANDQKWTALHFAAFGGHGEIVRLLLARGALIETTDENKWTPLHSAVANGHAGVVEVLVRNGASIESMAEDDLTPLHFAVLRGHADLVGVLLGKGASTEALTDDNRTSLHLAAEYGVASVVGVLLEKGALIEAMDKDKWTSLHWAAWKGHADVVGVLLEKGALIEAMDKDKWTSLHLAAWKGHADVVGVLLGNGASIEAMTEINSTPLHLAASDGNAGVVGVLLGNGASIEAMNEHNSTPLHLAALKGHSSVVGVLLKKGALIEAIDKDKWTPLHLAAFNGHAGVVEVLLEKGASIEALNNIKETPLQVATWRHHTNIVKLLNSKATRAAVHGNCA